MATYYVRTDGSDSNAGTGPATNQAWQTITKAIGATGIAPGDTLYIAPGVYRGTFTAGFTNPANSSQRITISGDPTASQFIDVTAGDVTITNYLFDTTTPASATTLTIAKDYVTITKLRFQGFNANNNGSDFNFNGGQFIITNCVFESLYQSVSNTQPALNISIPQSIPGCTVSNNFIRGNIAIQGSGTYTAHTDMNARIFSNTIVNTKGGQGYGVSSYQTDGFQGGIRIYNNVIIAAYCWYNNFGTMSSTYKCQIYNNFLSAYQTAISNASTATIEENYNYILATTARSNCSSGLNTVVNGRVVIDYDYSRLTGLRLLETFSPSINSPTRNAGTNTLASSNDMFGITWITPSTPTIGGIECQAVTGAGTYIPSERNASTITIAPGSTSQSIELYLGATGLTASTSGLSARYNRTRTASVSIPLVARTIAQAWTSGGFAEVDATNMPGVYRLDVPDAALAAGADDVTIVVRGASGTNGAVMTVKLSSGGLTSAQTASAVWDASTAGYSTPSNFGGMLAEDHQLAVSTDAVVNQIPNLVWDEARSSHTMAGTFGEYVNTNINTGAIADAVWDEARSGHTTAGTFGEYVNAELVTPVSQASLVRMGPFEVRADGLGASDPLDIQKGAQHGIDIQCVDNNGAGIDITSATVTAKVYNSGATLVDTYSCTATYAADGRATFTIDTTVTNTPGTYTATITRTTGASDTQVFGPLRIYVRDI